MEALRLMSLGAPGHVTIIFEAENRQRLDRFELV